MRLTGLHESDILTTTNDCGMIFTCEQTRRSHNLRRADSPRVCSHMPLVLARRSLWGLERAMPHNGIPIPPPTVESLRRILSKLNLPDECWEWAGTWRSDGYSNMGIGRKNYYVHRLMFQWFKHDIPDGLVIDHLCKNKRCVNPNHLEATDMKTNVGRALRRAYCRRGHPQIPENRYTVPKTGHSRCWPCLKVRSKQRRKKNVSR